MLSKDDKEWVRLIAKDLCFAVTKEVLKEHVKSCPYGKSLLFMIGVCIGSGLAGGAGGFFLAKTLVGIL